MAKEKTVAGRPGIDPTLPDVSIEVAGKKYQLCYDFNAICQVYAETRVNLLEGFELGNPIVLRAMFWASVLKHQPKLTVEDAGSLVNADTIGAITEGLMLAWGGSLPEENGKSADPTQAQS